MEVELRDLRSNPSPATATESTPSLAPESDPSIPYLASLVQRHEEKAALESRRGGHGGDGERPTIRDPNNRSKDDATVEEVRVTVSRKDDTSMPCNTFRMWFLGLLFTTAISFANQFYYMRSNEVTIGPLIVALVSLPLGHLLARILPTQRFHIPLFPGAGRRRQRGTGGGGGTESATHSLVISFTLNPGPFSIKEHVLIGVMANCNLHSAYAMNNIVMQSSFLMSRVPFIAGLLLVLTTQVTGLAFAGAFRRILVWPVQMVWPSTLVQASFYRGLHKQKENAEDAGRMSRMKYFWLATLGSFVWFWFPKFIFPTLSAMSVLCWINPENVILSQLTGSRGLGIGTISLDWTSVTYYLQPLITPWFAQVNILIGFVLMAYILVPLAYYTNLWDSKSYPIVSSWYYHANGDFFDSDSVVNKDGVLDEELYNTLGPIRMSSFIAIVYGIAFAAFTATIVHAILYHGKEIVGRSKIRIDQKEDVHMKLMRAYPEVPDRWYFALFIVCTLFSFIVCVRYDYMHWWVLILAFVIAFGLVLPLGLLQAITNQQPTLYAITEYIMGYLLPGRIIPHAMFKTYSNNIHSQTLIFLTGFKLGHYMKIPPRTMFFVQLISTIVGGTVNLATYTWLLNTYPDICISYQFSCTSTAVFHRASVLWGVIGPARIFGSKDGGIYGAMQWGFLIGALLPFVFWASSRQYPHVRWLKRVHWPALLTATSQMPPARPYVYANGLFIGFLFEFILRRYRFRWWARYNYLTSASLDTGVAIAGIALFFVFQRNGYLMPKWWGNPSRDQDHCPKSTSSFYGDGE
ncbi:hypothetical protein BGZ51_007042 [Haplosporangium sp. Z 767]|nr:hypothetical protein BGZ51_007042 [Haplosporangium sp. Z 767]KAF9179250.1 hypothetical protein BGZ50_007126 [Haplosporangium sp. Z 11]